MNCRMTTIFKGILATLCLLCISVAPAEAYIDPGTGSYIFQIIVATFFGSIYAIKLYWQQLKDFLSGTKKPTDESKPAEKSGNEPPPPEKK